MSKLVLGIEFGSTRIKSVLCDEFGKVLSSGNFDWENDYVDGHWSYPLDKVLLGLKESYRKLAENYKTPITHLDAIGISAMMHGYLAFDESWNLLAPFRTWRDTTTSEASKILTETLEFNMPQRWSATHYYQALLNKEDSAKKVAHLTTLAGYVHFLLTGENVLGANDASGMFPLLGENYDERLIEKFDKLADTDLKSLLPKVLSAGKVAGHLIKEGALLLDPTGTLKEGALFCPPEGDMGTGMVCTNSISLSTGQISSGTSANFTVVLEKPLKRYYPQIDIVATPDGYPAALIHTNNCTTEINEWVSLFSEVADLCGAKIDRDELFRLLFNKAAGSDQEVGKITAYNFLGGEPLAETIKGAPLVVRDCDGNLNLSNFMQALIYSAIASLSLGMDILRKEDVRLSVVNAHGGFYRTDLVGQIATSAILNAPVTIMSNAGEGGAWGIALLASYTLKGKGSLQEYLDEVFADVEINTILADEEQIQKAQTFLKNYKKYLSVEKLASEVDDA